MEEGKKEKDEGRKQAKMSGGEGRIACQREVVERLVVVGRRAER